MICRHHLATICNSAVCAQNVPGRSRVAMTMQRPCCSVGMQGPVTGSTYCTRIRCNMMHAVRSSARHRLQHCCLQARHWQGQLDREYCDTRSSQPLSTRGRQRHLLGRLPNAHDVTQTHAQIAFTHWGDIEMAALPWQQTDVCTRCVSLPGPHWLTARALVAVCHQNQSASADVGIACMQCMHAWRQPSYIICRINIPYDFVLQDLVRQICLSVALAHRSANFNPSRLHVTSIRV